MPVIQSTHDTDALTMTVITEFGAAPERVWEVWADPRQLERWWGPPTWPATFVEHELTTGTRTSYYMTGPDGDRAAGLWLITAVDAPHRVELDDSFADADGNPDESMPVSHMRMTLDPAASGTRMTLVTEFASREQLDQLLEMGMEEGMTLALGQIDGILAE